MSDRIIVVQKRSGCFFWIAIVVLAIVAAMIFRPSPKPTTPVPAAVQQKKQQQKEKEAADKRAAIEAEREKQPQRLALIQEWQKEGTFGKIEHRNGLVEVRVKAPWYLAAFDDKKGAAIVIWSYWYVENQALVVIKFTDDTNGKEVATYSDLTGLKIR